MIYLTDPPDSPIRLGLQVLPSNKLVLEWDRPHNVPSEVQITYMVVINGSEEDVVIFNTTQSQSLPLGFLEELVNLNNRSCEMFQFTIQAVNDAGNGTVSEPIIHTVPICETLALCAS